MRIEVWWDPSLKGWAGWEEPGVGQVPISVLSIKAPCLIRALITSLQSYLDSDAINNGVNPALFVALGFAPYLRRMLVNILFSHKFAAKCIGLFPSWLILFTFFSKSINLKNQDLPFLIL